MMDSVEFTDYHELMNLYLKDRGFSQHKIIKIVLKLYSLMMNLSQQSESTTLFLEQKKIKLSRFYGEQLDHDDRVYTRTINKMIKLLDASSQEPITEEDIFFMFILKISKRIEVAVHPPSLDKPISKIIYFPLEP
jgi:hypothetical protein